MSNTHGQYRNRALKYATAIIVLLLIFRAVDLSELIRALSQVTAELVVALLVLSLIMIYVSALKWRIILDGIPHEGPALASGKIETSRLFRLYLVGYFVNLILPSYVGGDLVRSLKLGKAVGQVRALAATVFERYTGLVAMVVLSFVFVWFLPGVTTQIVTFVGLIALATIFGTVFALFPISDSWWSRFPFGIGSKLSVSVRKLQSSFHLVRRNLQVMVSAFLLSFIYHSLTVLNTALAGAAVGWNNPSILQLFVVVPIILLIGAIPVSPQGLGIQEGAFYYFLQLAGATPAQALGVALVLRAKSYVLALIGGIAWYFEPKE